MTLVNEPGDWEVSLWGRNLTNNLHFVYALTDTVVGITSAIKHPTPPRTYGVEFTKRF
jgi:outer membrane receptor protein involved in Fe transport